MNFVPTAYELPAPVNAAGEIFTHLSKSKYYGGELALVLNNDNNDPSDIVALTVNLGPLEEPDQFFLDVNSIYASGAALALTQFGVIKRLKETRRSGFVEYPMYRFAEDTLAQ